jgi:hypothetical protein
MTRSEGLSISYTQIKSKEFDYSIYSMAGYTATVAYIQLMSHRSAIVRDLPWVT